MESKSVRLNSEKTISNANFKIKIGTTNKVDPQVVYIEGKTFIQPEEVKDDYTRDISEIKRKFNRSLQSNLSKDQLFTNKYICEFQVAKNGIASNKKTFLSFQFLFRQRSDRKIMKLKDIKNASEPLINNIVNELADHIENHNFTITKTKR